MKRFQPFVFSAALLFLAACGQDTQPAAATPSFNFSVDPAAGSVNLTSADAQTLKALQIGECGSGEPRILFAEEELALTSYDAAFLPGNLLQITAEFTNVTDFTFEQPFTFTQAESTSNIVSSQEPEVTDADLGGDGALSPDETTSTLTFTVEHKGQPFTYEVFAEAVVDCGDGDGGPTDPVDPVDPVDPEPGSTDLAVTKDGTETIEIDPDTNSATVTYSVNLANTGDVATAVTLTDLLDVDLSAAATIESVTITASSIPAGCTAGIQVDNSLNVDCNLGDLADGASDSLEFVFDLAFTGTLNEGDSALVTNTATAATTTNEPVTDNNSDDAQTIITPVATTDPVITDLAVVKTGEPSVVLDAAGDGTLTFDVALTNTGSEAVNVVLADALALDLTAAGDATATVAVTPGTLPLGCELDATQPADGVAITCNLGNLPDGATETLTFSFDLTTEGLDGEESITVTNAAAVSSDTAEDVTDNNSSEAITVVTPLPPA